MERKNIVWVQLSLENPPAIDRWHDFWADAWVPRFGAWVIAKLLAD